MFWTIFLLLIFLLLVFILLMPILMVVDTISGAYYIQFEGIGKASFEPHDEKVVRVHLRLFFFSRYFYPLEYKRKKTKKRIGKPKQRSRDIGFKKIMRLLKSFTIKELYLNIDTGDYCLNAKMFPAIFAMNQIRNGFRINFKGENQLILHIENRPIHLLKSFINF